MFKSKPRPVWQASCALHFANGVLYSQVIIAIWRCVALFPSADVSDDCRMRKLQEEKQLLTEGEEFEAKFIKRD